jgi:hypothetical protein
MRNTQVNKFTRLLQEKRQFTLTQGSTNRSTANQGTVVNLSSRVLKPEEECVLSRGLGFAVTPKQVNTLDVVASLEANMASWPGELRDDVRHELKKVLKKTSANQVEPFPK